MNDPVKVENMARHILASKQLLPHQLKAFAYLDEILTPEQRNTLTKIWRIPPENYVLLFLPTEDWQNTPRGRLRVWYLILYDSANRNVVDRVLCYSGAPDRQHLIDPKLDKIGSLRPINPGLYKVGPVEVAKTDSFGEGLGRIWIGLEHTNPVNNRYGFGIHLDSNYKTSPGSAGCIVTPSEIDLQKIVTWVKRYRIKFLEVKYTINMTPTINTEDVITLAKTIYGEARGEIEAGQYAVACVVRNRVLKSPTYGWPNTYKGVCLQKWQFSCWNSNDPNRVKLDALSPDAPELRRFIQIAKEVISGQFPDNTKGADHYFASYIPAPFWAVGRTPVARYGVHLFFKIT